MSEIAQLRQKIEEECAASWLGLHGLAAGNARHEFIRVRFKNMENYHARLSGLVGEEDATAILYEIYNKNADKQ